MCMAICKRAIFFSFAFLIGANAFAVTKKVSAARKLYKDGEYAKAAEIYANLDLESMDYLRTREELAWSYLRAGDWGKLRGTLAHLNSTIVPLRFRLEGRVMSAMLHLRECQYEKVKEDMKIYQTEMAPFVRKVSRELTRSNNKPYWQSLNSEISESLLKMKFVRMELRSRLVMLSRSQVIDGQSTKDLNSQVPKDAQTFPLDDKELWVDEVFMARGDGNAVCAELHNANAKVTR